MKPLALAMAAFLWVSAGYAADPTIAYIRVAQDNIRILGDSCSGIIQIEADDTDNDSLLLAIQVSADNGTTWMVPLQSDFFIKVAPGAHAIPFCVPGRHGDSCRVKITAYDALPAAGTLRYIPARGHAFLMGSNGIRPEENPRHTVAFSHDFWMDTAEMSEERFKAFKPDYVPQYTGIFFYTNSHPVDNCYWHWAIQYCNWRSRQEGLDACYSGLPADTGDYWDYYKTKCDPLKNGYRLPSEAEWEYACRAGTITEYFWGDDSSAAAVNKYCWNYSNFHDTIHGPALLAANRFGLYDMSGGMLELCNDWYDTSYYAHSPVFDPQGPSLPAYYVGSDPFRATRGGHFQSSPQSLTSSTRIGNFSSARHPQSFRCVRTMLP